ncbi:hypothetical protein BC830DRAFT_1095385 [Chytriomyces sp. MP71]|nr:hypothetical protein BC830DRAFT_1095385 [Chytriomyces sp. MP71]
MLSATMESLQEDILDLKDLELEQDCDWLCPTSPDSVEPQPILEWLRRDEEDASTGPSRTTTVLKAFEARSRQRTAVRSRSSSLIPNDETIHNQFSMDKSEETLAGSIETVLLGVGVERRVNPTSKSCYDTRATNHSPVSSISSLCKPSTFTRTSSDMMPLAVTRNRATTLQSAKSLSAFPSPVPRKTTLSSTTSGVPSLESASSSQVQRYSSLHHVVSMAASQDEDICEVAEVSKSRKDSLSMNSLVSGSRARIGSISRLPRSTSFVAGSTGVSRIPVFGGSA